MTHELLHLDAASSSGLPLATDASPAAVPSETVITLQRELPGFPGLTELELRKVDEYGIFVWLASCADETVSFMGVNPFVYFPDYEVEVDDEIVTDLVRSVDDELVAYCLVTLNPDHRTATANLLAPIVVNITQGRAVQIILETDHQLRAPLPVPPVDITEHEGDDR